MMFSGTELRVPAAEKFQYHLTIDITIEIFAQVLGDFLSFLCRENPIDRQTLSCRQARSEAVSMMETYYQGVSGNGFHVAYLESKQQPEDGIRMVLNRLADIHIMLTRKKYIHWIFASRISVLDWQDRRRIVEAFKQIWKSVFPETFLNIPSAMLVERIPDLLKSIREARLQTISLYNSTMDHHQE